MKPGKKAGRIASRVLTVMLSLALFITMMPFGIAAVFAADAADYQPALTITGPDGTVKTYQTREEVIEAFGSGTDDSSFGAALEGIYVKKLLSGYDDDAVVTVQTQDDYTGTLNASGKTVQELKSLKGILAYKEDGNEYDPTSDEVNAKGKKLYGGYFVWFVGNDESGNVLKDKWVNRITISGAGGDEPEPEPEPAAVLTVTGEGLTNELSFNSIKELKNDEAVKPLIVETSFHTINSVGTEEDFTVTGVRIEDLIGLAGIKGGYELESVTAYADNETSGKTYTADEILKEDLQGNKAMFIWDENGQKVQKTAVGQFAEGENNRGKWWKGNTISLVVSVKALPVLTVTGSGLVNELSYKDIKEMKNDEAIKAITRENVTYKTKNNWGAEGESTVTGVRIEDLIKLAKVKKGYVIKSVTATASDGYVVTYSADEILKKDLQGNKAMFVWLYDGEKIQMTTVGQYKAGEANKAKWNAGDAFNITVNTKKVTKPGKTKVTLKAGKKKATVSWKKVSGAEGYVIYRSVKKSKGFKRIKTVTSGKTLKFVNKKLKGGKVYYYKVKAYKKDANGNKILGSYSAVKKIKTKR